MDASGSRKRNSNDGLMRMRLFPHVSGIAVSVCDAGLWAVYAR